MNADITVVKASHLIPFINYLDKHGLPVDELLAKEKLSRIQFTAPDNLIPEAPFWAFLDLVATRQGIPDIGFKVTEQLSMDAFGAFGAKIMQAKNLRCALEAFIDLMGQQSNCPTFWLKQDDDGVWFCRLGTQGIKKGLWPVEQHVVSMMSVLVRGYTQNAWNPPKVHLQTNNLTGLRKNKYLQDSEVALNKKVTAIFIPVHYLHNHPIAIPRKDKFTENDEIIPRKFNELLTRFIKQRGQLSLTNAGEVATQLGVSVRQLQRLLKRTDSSFRDISEGILFEQAKLMLIEKQLSVIDVSLELGYSDTANFTRAFKRWAGMSPKEFKQNNLSEHYAC